MGTPRFTPRRRKAIPYDRLYTPGGTYVMYGRNNEATYVTYIGRNDRGMRQFIDHKTGTIYTGYNLAVQQKPKATNR